MRSSPPRLMMYSHDSYGLGHLQRCVRIASALTEAIPGLMTMIASGAPRPECFRMPRDCELLALPVITKDDRGNYVSATPDLTLADAIGMRADALVRAARSFVPDVIIVDHVAVGVGGELLPMLSDLDRRSPRPAIVLGLRDIIDTDVTVEREWHALGVLPVLQDVYDLVLVYGDPSVLTTAQELRLPELLGDRLLFTGYLGDPHGSAAAVADHREKPLSGYSWGWRRRGLSHWSVRFITSSSARPS